MDVLRNLFFREGRPAYIRSNNGSEFRAKELVEWLAELGVKTAYIAQGSPWENGYNESFNGRLRDEFLSCESFYTLQEAQVLIEDWRDHYSEVRPHSALGVPSAAMARSSILPHSATLHDAGQGDELPRRTTAYLRADHDSRVAHTGREVLLSVPDKVV